MNGFKTDCLMKHYTKLFFAAAVAALGLASCAKEVAPVETPKDNLVTVHFGATAGIEGATKATLTTDDELTFTSAWENGDALSVKYSYNETTEATTSGTVSASWATDHFEAKMPEHHGMWNYNVVYPAPDAESKVDFGSARTQKGNAYNSKYDLMKGGAIEENADAGKTADKKNIVFEMTRQTAIAYFHLTSTLDEEVVSAKLSVTDGNIASSLVMLLDHTDGFDLSTKDLNEITITFEEGTAPKASNFQLWYNVLPTEYSKMTLTVETTGHTLTISRTVPKEVLLDEYVAGKLYKVVKKIPAEKWATKAAYTGGDLIFDFKTEQPKGWPDSKDNAQAGTYKYAVNGVDYSFILGKGVYCAGTTPASAYLMITKSSSLGLPAIAGYKLTKVIGTLNDAGNPSKKAEICITDGANVVSGGTAQTWDTMGKDYTYTLAETEENTVYYLSVSSTANCQMTKLVLSYEPATHRTALETPANLQVSAEKVISWDAVSGAASYEVTIGENSFTSETTSYDAADITDDYYDVAVVAVPSDKDNYKNSAAATLTGVKFGVPTLATPTLKEGVVDGASISVSWSVDESATAGYNCELFKGGVKVGESKTVNAGAVTFTGLDAETAYVVKVNAIAVEGAKSYAASQVATLDITTKAAGSAAGPTTVTKTMDSIVTENNYTISKDSNIGTKQKTLKIDDVVELSSTGGGNTGSFWGTAPDIDWRCYEATNSVVKISAKEGYIIEKFTLTFKIGNKGTLDGGNIKSGTAYNVNAQSVSYKIGHTGKKANGQIRITGISVTYKQQ